MGKKILVVEDEKHLADGICFNLELEGFETVHFDNGARALDDWDSVNSDLILLDLMLPGVDGMTILKSIRKKNKVIPIMILSAKGASNDRIIGLEHGCDDYLSKPFELKELLLRIKSLLRRGPKSINVDMSALDTIYSFSDGHIDFEASKVKSKYGVNLLTEHEKKLLGFFCRNENKVLSREEILHHVWGVSRKTDTRTLDNFIVKLRKYFEENPKNPKHFICQRGRGYVFIPFPE